MRLSPQLPDRLHGRQLARQRLYAAGTGFRLGEQPAWAAAIEKHAAALWYFEKEPGSRAKQVGSSPRKTVGRVDGCGAYQFPGIIGRCPLRLETRTWVIFSKQSSPPLPGPRKAAAMTQTGCQWLRGPVAS